MKKVGIGLVSLGLFVFIGIRLWTSKQTSAIDNAVLPEVQEFESSLSPDDIKQILLGSHDSLFEGASEFSSVHNPSHFCPEAKIDSFLSSLDFRQLNLAQATIGLVFFYEETNRVVYIENLLKMLRSRKDFAEYRHLIEPYYRPTLRHFRHVARDKARIDDTKKRINYHQEELAKTGFDRAKMKSGALALARRAPLCHHTMTPALLDGIRVRMTHHKAVELGSQILLQIEKAGGSIPRKVSEAKGYNEFLQKEIHVDAWWGEFELEQTSPTSFVVVSAGRDGQINTDDDMRSEEFSITHQQ
jgi:hypothetical protein